MNIQEKIKVMQEYADNPDAVVQVRPRHACTAWATILKPIWNWEGSEYRIQPQPKKFWILVTSRDGRYVYDDEISAKNMLEQLRQEGLDLLSYIVSVQEI